MNRIQKDEIVEALRTLGVVPGDTLLVRAGLSSIGRIDGGATAFVNAMLDAVGPAGTVVSLAFTDSAFIKRPRPEDAFHAGKKSYAGGLPNTMLTHPAHRRSRHPMCSFVAIGALAAQFTEGHDARSGAYAPMRHLIDAGAKCLLIGCVDSSPGFTTTHLAETDLNLHKRFILPRLSSAYFFDESGRIQLFRRSDPGLCSMSFYKFYAHYVRHGILTTGYVGNAYSIIAPARDAYRIDVEVLKADPGFNVCGKPDCFTCNARRWDRLHRLPLFIARRALKKVAARGAQP